MKKTRRGFVGELTAMAGVLALGRSRALGQTPAKPTFPKPPTPGDPQERDKNAVAPDPQATNRTSMRQNEKEFRAGVERLYQLSSELREELQNTATMNVLSVRMYKKTEEIEKLAKQLKSKARGG
jgi:hypothetical protein